MKYEVFFEERAEKELAKIEKPFQRLIVTKIKQLAENFDSLANNLKILKGKNDYYRLRVGNFRVIFYKDDAKIVITIVRIGHRKDIYERL
ncbi:MAG: type II toxin-antitoxin system RelE/ParE family toxin [Candidatus Aminicenantes bacterium]|nr:type II toxin-antitoxin system RelE/ParE family toxin [Candidatus Aminicenantes bacterium]